jgi:hypothetical protein
MAIKKEIKITFLYILLKWLVVFCAFSHFKFQTKSNLQYNNGDQALPGILTLIRAVQLLNCTAPAISLS